MPEGITLTTNFTIKESHIQMILSTSGHVDFESGIDVLNAQSICKITCLNQVMYFGCPKDEMN